MTMLRALVAMIPLHLWMIFLRQERGLDFLLDYLWMLHLGSAKESYAARRDTCRDRKLRRLSPCQLLNHHIAIEKSSKGSSH